ncbi:hypothetical protein RPE78_05525 [Thioclava litoralis]|uniref:Uncharacterized protein n=1 Tax=Thioclava litoralis TaxID=3076557 RepID=A0ABZ1E3S7_9RHOB|nr:hypothetical protein RPE78_05525 [Thioclava sp. FTW29]
MMRYNGKTAILHDEAECHRCYPDLDALRQMALEGSRKAITGHSGVEMLKKYGGQERQKVLAMKAQEARNRAWTEQAQNTNVSKLVSKNQERKKSNDASH